MRSFILYEEDFAVRCQSKASRLAVLSAVCAVDLSRKIGVLWSRKNHIALGLYGSDETALGSFKLGVARRPEVTTSRRKALQK